MKKKFTEALQRIRQALDSKLFLFRLAGVVLAIDFIAFLALAAINPLQLLNPTQFFDAVPVDERKELTLYYPSSMIREKRPENTLNIIGVKQRVFQSTKKESTEDNARYILQELLLGSQDLKSALLFRHKDLIRRVWMIEKRLVVHLNKTRWSKLPKEQTKLATACMQRSLVENLSIDSVRFVL